MITCAIIDDEPYAIKLLEDYASKLLDVQVLSKFTNALEALEFLRTQKVDLLFLDISMPKLSGMELAKIMDPRQKIVFTTAFSEHAVESYSVNAIDYLLKPVKFEEFLRAVDKVRNVRQSTGTTSGSILFIKSGKAMVRASYDDILYIEGLKDYVVFHVGGKKHIAYKRMKELETSLPAQFQRLHLSYIVNTQHIDKFEDSTVTIGGARLPVSEKYREAFLKFLRERTV